MDDKSSPGRGGGDVRERMQRHLRELAGMQAWELTARQARELARDIYDGWSGWYWSWHWPDRYEELVAKIGAEAEAQADEMERTANELRARAKAARALAGVCHAAMEVDR